MSCRRYIMVTQRIQFIESLNQVQRFCNESRMRIFIQRYLAPRFRNTMSQIYSSYVEKISFWFSLLSDFPCTPTVTLNIASSEAAPRFIVHILRPPSYIETYKRESWQFSKVSNSKAPERLPDSKLRILHIILDFVLHAALYTHAVCLSVSYALHLRIGYRMLYYSYYTQILSITNISNAEWLFSTHLMNKRNVFTKSSDKTFALGTALYTVFLSVLRMSMIVQPSETSVRSIITLVYCSDFNLRGTTRVLKTCR